jgi:hypothetical protein
MSFSLTQCYKLKKKLKLINIINWRPKFSSLVINAKDFLIFGPDIINLYSPLKMATIQPKKQIFETQIVVFCVICCLYFFI